MCTWSGMRCPSSTRLSFCCARLRNTSPRCLRNCRYSVFLLHFGMKTTWYLQSHLVLLRLSYTSIAKLPFVWLGRSRLGVSSVDYRCKCRTFAAPRQSRGISYDIRSSTAIRFLAAYLIHARFRENDQLSRQSNHEVKEEHVGADFQ